MNERLEDVATTIVTSGKGILAADKNSGTIKKRFDLISLNSTEDTCRNYREMLFRPHDVAKSLNGCCRLSLPSFMMAA